MGARVHHPAVTGRRGLGFEADRLAVADELPVQELLAVALADGDDLVFFVEDVDDFAFFKFSADLGNTNG